MKHKIEWINYLAWKCHRNDVKSIFSHKTLASNSIGDTGVVPLKVTNEHCVFVTWCRTLHSRVMVLVRLLSWEYSFIQTDCTFVSIESYCTCGPICIYRIALPIPMWIADPQTCLMFKHSAVMLLKVWCNMIKNNFHCNVLQLGTCSHHINLGMSYFSGCYGYHFGRYDRLPWLPNW